MLNGRLGIRDPLEGIVVLAKVRVDPRSPNRPLVGADLEKYAKG